LKGPTRGACAHAHETAHPISILAIPIAVLATPSDEIAVPACDYS
jgi:hypothetical protein